MRTILLGVAAAGLIAGCTSDSAPPAEQAETVALLPGEYDISAKIDSFRSTDKATPATRAKVGDPPATRRACVAAGGNMPVEAFADAGDLCTASSSYVRNGRLNLQLSCSRPGHGTVMQLADGSFKADSFEAKLNTATYFTGSGDYAMTRSFTGKRVGECSAVPAKPETGKAKQ